MAFGAVRCYNTMSAPPPPHVPPPPPIGSSHPPGPPPTSAGPPLPKAGTKKKWAAVVAEQTLSKWSVDPLWKFDPTLSSIDVNSTIDWTRIKGICAAEEGSGGVFFVQFASGSLVLKSSLTIASDIFASRLANRLNIHTPATKLVYYMKSEEWDPMVQKLWEMEQTNSVAGRGSKLAKCLNRPFLLLSEYIPGYHLANVPKDKAESIVGSSSVLNQIGRLISFDMLLNQWDRFPCGTVWDNDGNPKNVIFTPTNHFQYSVDAIDNNMTSIDPTTHAGNFENFKNKVAGVLMAIVHSGEAACGVTKSTRDFITIHSGYDIGDNGQVEIQKGIIEGAQIIADLPVLELEELKASIDKQVRETLSLLGVDDDHIGFSRINVKYLQGMHSSFVEMMKKRPPL